MNTVAARDLALTKSQSGALLNLSELALVLFVGRDFVGAMCKAGFKTFGGKTTREDALKWLRANPDFKTCQQRSLPKFQRKLPIQRRNLPIRRNGLNSRGKPSTTKAKP